MFGLINEKLPRIAFNYIAKSLCTKVSNISSYLYIHPNCDPVQSDILQKDIKVYLDFVTEDEENSLLEEIDKVLRLKRYEVDHWDDAIHGYREMGLSSWNSSNQKVIDRIRSTVFQSNDTILRDVHILDLAETGYIKPHVDSVEACGNTIAGLSLLTDSVMRFICEENKAIKCDALLKRRSLYVMKDIVRFKYAHAILKNEESVFNGIPVPKGRRISLINRNEKLPKKLIP